MSATLNMVLRIGAWMSDAERLTVNQREGSKPSIRPVTLRSSHPFETERNGETKSTTAKNGAHTLALTAEQAAEVERVVSILSDPKNKERATLVETIRAAGGIALPVNRQGKPPRKGESLADAFADLL